MTPTEVVDRLLPSRLQARASSEQFAPSNIALCKYWGKRERSLNLPVNASLSVSLDHLGSHTRLSPIDAKQDEIRFNGRPLPLHAAFSQRVTAFIDLFRRQQPLCRHRRNRHPAALLPPGEPHQPQLPARYPPGSATAGGSGRGVRGGLGSAACGLR